MYGESILKVPEQRFTNEAPFESERIDCNNLWKVTVKQFRKNIATHT
jgi:hypothetical protein